MNRAEHLGSPTSDLEVFAEQVAAHGILERGVGGALGLVQRREHRGPVWRSQAAIEVATALERLERHVVIVADTVRVR
ncbi:hypothetical protein OV203_34130 [Nannocystis sp. ILAH1]|uniref:hypothetical protein n=1 Tax=unclassified Nannocystis TaxID=2627009 RepID=UPI0022719775|nr:MULTISPECIES: hypothetical protein [unclassified Nannocystis]MCY0992227.1 hypothetical protein [Nannocystis sp. ILAH1]MCY1069184.1 hypothetical protein [Nannocystis sp. RBIL2]